MVAGPDLRSDLPPTGPRQQSATRSGRTARTWSSDQPLSDLGGRLTAVGTQVRGGTITGIAITAITGVEAKNEAAGTVPGKHRRGGQRTTRGSEVGTV